MVERELRSTVLYVCTARVVGGCCVLKTFHVRRTTLDSLLDRQPQQSSPARYTVRKSLLRRVRGKKNNCDSFFSSSSSSSRTSQWFISSPLRRLLNLVHLLSSSSSPLLLFFSNIIPASTRVLVLGVFGSSSKQHQSRISCPLIDNRNHGQQGHPASRIQGDAR